MSEDADLSGDLAGGFAPADADAAHGGVAAIARQRAGIGLHDQQREQQDAGRGRPALAKIDDALAPAKALAERAP